MRHGKWMARDYAPGLVSVIVPTYNRSGMIKMALDSVWAQSYRPLELLVVDDGSTDETEPFVSRWINTHAGDPAFTARLLQQENSGAPSARNLGLINSRGEFIQFLDSDDVLHPLKIETHVAMLETPPDCDFAWSDHEIFDIENEQPEYRQYDVATLVRNSTCFENVPILGTTGNAWTGLYRRKACFKTGPWNETLERWQDLEYNLRFTSLGPACRYTRAYLGSMGKHEAPRIQAMKHSREGIEAGFHTLKTMEADLEALEVPAGVHARHSIANFYLRLAILAMKTGTAEQVKQALQGMLRNRPEKGLLVKIRAIEILYRILGGRIAALTIRGYSKARLNN